MRKITATKFYETLLALTDISPSLINHQDEILAIHSDTNLNEDVEAPKTVRYQLRLLLISASRLVAFYKFPAHSFYYFNLILINCAGWLISIDIVVSDSGGDSSSTAAISSDDSCSFIRSEMKMEAVG